MDQPVTASMVMYIKGVHPSSVIHWKIVSHACAMLSK